jgi:hypothetical protein
MLANKLTDTTKKNGALKNAILKALIIFRYEYELANRAIYHHRQKLILDEKKRAVKKWII